MAGDKQRFETALNHARRFSSMENWPEAMKAYRFALAEFPNDEVAITGFGEAALAGGQNEFAWKAFRQALKINPSNFQALIYIGEMQEQSGETGAAAETYLRAGNVLAAHQPERAIDLWQRTIRLVPEHVDAHHNLSQAFAQQGQVREAARQLLVLAATYQHRGDIQRAGEQIESARNLLPDDPGILAAFQALQEGELIEPEAIEESPATSAESDFFDQFSDHFRDAELFEGEDPFALEEHEAELAIGGGLIEAARQKAMTELANVIFEEDVQGAVRATMSREELNRLIIQALESQRHEDVTEATRCYHQVLKAGGGRPALYFNLGLLHQAQGQFDEAARVLKMAAQDNSYSISAQFALGQAFYAGSKLDLAVSHFIEALKMIDLKTLQGEKARQLLQVYEKHSADLTQASSKKIEKFIKALENFFANPDWERRVFEARQRMNSVTENGTIMSLAEFLESPETEVGITTMAVTAEYLKRNMLMTASEECLWAIQRAPSYLPLHIRLAEVLLKQERTDDAITKYLYVAKVYQMRNQSDQAIGIYQRILRLAPMDVTVRSRLIDLYTSHGHVEQALEQYLLLADSYYQLAQVDRALEKYHEALRLSATVPNVGGWRTEILVRMGDIYNQRFDWARATSAFEELLKISPQDERVQRQLMDLYYKRNKVSEANALLDKLLVTYQQNQPVKGMELLRELSSLYPDNLALRQRLAAVYIKNNRKREAIAEYDALGEMQLEKGLRDEAMQTIKAIINLGPDDIEGYRRLLTQIGGGAI